MDSDPITNHKPTVVKKPPGSRQPWHAYEWEPADAYALQAVARGIANEVQQKRAIDWIINSAGTFGPTFYVGQHDASDFAQGSRHVGLQIIKLLRLSATAIEKAK
jgi:hypothetical protein